MKVIVSSYIWWQNKFFPTVSTSSPADTLNQKLLLHLHEKCLSHNLKTMPQEVLRRNSLTWVAVTTIRRWLWHLGPDTVISQVGAWRGCDMPRIMLNTLANQAELSPAYTEVRRSQQKDSVCSHEDSGSPRGGDGRRTEWPFVEGSKTRMSPRHKECDFPTMRVSLGAFSLQPQTTSPAWSTPLLQPRDAEHKAHITSYKLRRVIWSH